MWPLGFWLPTTYASASAPVAAMLVLMTKVGVYAVLRVWLAVFGDPASAPPRLRLHRADPGWHGDPAVRRHRHARQPGRRSHGGLRCGRLLGHAAGGIGQAGSAVLASGLYYLLGSTLAMAAFMLLIELTERIRTAGCRADRDHHGGLRGRGQAGGPGGRRHSRHAGLPGAELRRLRAGHHRHAAAGGLRRQFSLFHALLAAAPRGCRRHLDADRADDPGPGWPRSSR